MDNLPNRMLRGAGSLRTLLVCLAILSVQLLAGQALTLAEDVQATLQVDEQQAVMDITSPIVAKYESLLTNIIDKKKGAIDRDKARQFERLFTLNSKIINDLREEPEEYPISVVGYLELIEDYFSRSGVLFTINSATIVDVQYDATISRYNVEVILNKSVENYFTADGDLERGDRNYDLKMIVTFKRGEPETGRISTISLRDGVFAADYARYLGISAGVGFGSASFTPSAILAGEGQPGVFDVGVKRQLNAGLFYLSNFINPKGAAGKNLFLAAEVGVSNSSVTSTLTSYRARASVDNISAETPQGAFPVSIDRIASDVDVTEDVNLTQITAGIGLSYRILDGEKSSLFVTAQYVPGFIIASSGDLSGRGEYNIGIDANLPNGAVLDFSSGEQNAFNPNSDFASSYDIGSRNFTAKTSIDAKLSHGLRFGASFFEDLLVDSPTYGLGISVSYYLPLSSGVDRSVSEDQPFLFTDDDNRSFVDPGLLGVFDTDTQFSSLSINLKFFLKNRRRP